MRYFLLAAGIAVSIAAAAQTRYLGLGAEFGVAVPQAAWSERYGPINTAAVRVEWAVGRAWSYALRGDLLFGNNVEVDPLAALRADAGPILGEDGLGEVGYSEVALRARGYRLQALVGYDWGFGESPWRLHLAAGPHYLIHQLRIQDDPALRTPQLSEERKPGYDRRAGGVGASLEAGARYLGSGGRYVAYLLAGGSATASDALRETQFDSGNADYQDGADATLTLRLGLLLPLLRGTGDGPAAGEIYY